MEYRMREARYLADMSPEYFAVTAPGLEAITAAELTRLGIETTGVEPGGVSFTGGQAVLQRANLECRTASRITMRLGSFEARTWFELERHAAKLDWGGVLGPGSATDFEVTSKKSRLYHQKGIAERLARIAGAPIAGDAEAPAQRFVVRVLRDRFTISADSSGALLHRRGYRLETGRAPMRETLAAAMLLAADWDGTTALVDPLAGSGTIPIEAALLARRIPPGLGRHFAFETWPSFDATGWQRLVGAARAAVLPHASVPIAGSDRDAGAVQAAQANAERAGVGGDITFRHSALSGLRVEGPPGLLLSNPPYGARVSGGTDLRNLYAQLGNLARGTLPGWSVGLLVADRALAGQVGLAWEERFSTTNGGIRVAFVMGQVHVPEPHTSSR
jgi:putative N6-adenine-specific DNA methylase